MKRQELLRSAYGGVLLAAPVGTLAKLTGLLGVTDENHSTTTVVMRILGARHVVQAVITLAVDARGATPRWIHRVGGVIDAAHLFSLPLLARYGNPAQRRLLACDAVVETLFAATELTIPAQG